MKFSFTHFSHNPFPGDLRYFEEVIKVIKIIVAESFIYYSIMSLARSLLAPVLFLSHGAGPAAFIDGSGSRLQDVDKNSLSAQFLRTVKDLVSDNYGGQDITSIVVVSAHWEEPLFQVDYQIGETKLLYDYGGFPKETYAPHLTYPVPTDLKLAERIYGMLLSAGLKTKLEARSEGGFDHGVFIPLKLAFPEANIPVVQVSLHGNLDISAHIKLGEALAPLRREGVLIIGSGSITHGRGNLQQATQFSDWIRDLLEGTHELNYAERRQALIEAPSRAPHYALNHPRTEHFIPLAVSFGACAPVQHALPDAASGEAESTTSKLTVKRAFHQVAMGSLGLDSYIFTNPV